MREVPPDLLHRLRNHHQEHLLAGWDELSPTERVALVGQISGIDFGEMERLYAGRDEPHPLPSADRIAPVTLESHEILTAEHRKIGEDAITSGELAILLVAGGQGSRLGFDKPKGMFPIGPVSNKSLFRIHAEKVYALGRRHGRSIPFLIMTSPVTHDDTENYFREHDYFGLTPGDVYFFQQGTLPALDLETGRILLEKPGKIFTSPNGHGGTLTALADSGLLDAMRARGVKTFFYFQVDNPLVKIGEAAFLGRHKELGSEASSKAILKVYPKEKMGVLALVDGRCGIIEYSDMPPALLEATTPTGELLHRAGNPAIHLFDLEFLARITQGAGKLPIHYARKKVPYWSEGRLVSPTKENALKFEVFVFDALPLAERTLTLEGPRAEEFAPVKNAEGVDCPMTAKLAMMNLAGIWLESAGVSVPRDANGNVAVPLEISPRFALDREELAARMRGPRLLSEPSYFD